MFWIVFLCSVAQSYSWFLSGDPKPGDPPRWDKLSVKFGVNPFSSFNKMPIDTKSAKSDGWVLTNSCDDKAYFRGNRYVNNGDTSVMLLFDNDGKIAGIQLGIRKTYLPKPKNLPWNLDGDMYVMTAYFVDPQTICGGGRSSSKYIGDKLLIQIGESPDVHMIIPIDESGLKSTNWIKGGCFLGMGQHYWYNISIGMNCDDFYPVFLLYDDHRLTGFGWNTRGFIPKGMFEYPVGVNDSPSRIKQKLGYFFGSSDKVPTCLMSSGPLTTQHVYLTSWPMTNYC